MIEKMMLIQITEYEDRTEYFVPELNAYFDTLKEVV